MPDEQLQGLVAKRGNIKAQLTRFRNYLSNQQIDQTIHHFEVQVAYAEKLYDQFNEFQCQIESIDISDLEDQEQSSFKDMYFDAIATAKRIIAERLQMRSVNSTHETSTSGSQPGVQVKLPTISLPEFSGAYEEWTQFSEMFDALIHSNNSITQIQRFHYLRAALKKDAAHIISSLELFAANYKVAWQLLKDRFENERMIVNNHVKALFELTSATKDSHVSIRQLVDSILKHLRALKALKQPTDQWDTLIIHLIFTKLDYNSRKKWESSIKDNKIPNLEQMIKFLTARAQILETIASTQNATEPVMKFNQAAKYTDHTKSHFVTQNAKCLYCKNSHSIFKCFDFLKLSIADRKDKVTNWKLCLNCLRPGHQNAECKASKCRVCNKMHNTLIHTDETPPQVTQQDVGSSSISTHCAQEKNTHIILGTALVHIINAAGKVHECRALLDSDSQSNFITQNLCKRLNLKCHNIDMPDIAINQVTTNISRKTKVKLKSRANGFNEDILCLVLSDITGKLPNTYISRSAIAIPDNITLADPNFNIPNKIDLLLGASVFWNLLCVGQLKASIQHPKLQKTQLGWIISGPITEETKPAKETVCNLSLDNQVERFWQIEGFENTSSLTQSELKYEEHFKNTITHSQDGRFIASLPFNNQISNLGESTLEAMRRLQSMERRFERNPKLREQYGAFMQEYEDMGHMSKISSDKERAEFGYYMPHHSVMKESSDTTKLRVVFDDSCKSNGGISLNDAMLVGPVIQSSLFSIVCRFRIHNYVVAGDIAKMYRQVCIREDQRKYQRILWRNSPQEEVKTYELATVTYGTASAPYLAVRCLHEVGIENQHGFPDACKIILQDFYVDDLITGSDSLEYMQRLANEVKTLLQTRGFENRKWASNEAVILKSIADVEQSTAADVYLSDNKEWNGMLGLSWHTELDILQYKVAVSSAPKRITKRTLLSTIVQIFDPLGLIGPTTIKTKIILQQLWQLKLEWDESVPIHIYTAWKTFHEKLPYLNKLRIPRNTICQNASEVQLHGFADASETVYGACI